MKITDALLGEHSLLYAQFDHLGQAVPATGNLIQAQAPLVTATLTTHARVEDDLLFTALEPYLGTQAGPLAVMRLEHDEIEHALARLLEVQDPAEAQDLAQQAIQIALLHFAKEEQVLFPMAEQVLDAETLADLGTQWAERRGVTVP